MQVIADIADTIEELLDRAESHINEAIIKKETYPQIATIYYNLSVVEMNQVDIFHGQIVNLITEYRKTQGEPPERMMGRYEYIHEKQIKQANKVKILQSIYK